MDLETLEDRIRGYLLDELIAEEDAEALTRETPLITSGVLDSIATLNLVSFLEDEFGIAVEAHEIDAENLNTIAHIASLVAAKQGAD